MHTSQATHDINEISLKFRNSKDPMNPFQSLKKKNPENSAQ